MGTCKLNCGQPPDSKDLITSPEDIVSDKADLTKTVNTKETTNTQEPTSNPHYLQAHNLNLSEYFGPNHEQSEIKDPIMPSNNISVIEQNGNSVYLGIEERNELIKLCQIDKPNDPNNLKNKTTKVKKKKNVYNKRNKPVYITKNKSVNNNSNTKIKKKENKK